MCKEYEDNRQLLVRLVYSHSHFTEEEIISEYSKQKGSKFVDSFTSIKGYLKLLRENGALTYRAGTYYVEPIEV